MTKVLLSIPDPLAARFRATIPARQRNKTIVQLIEDEVKRREKLLYESALAVEKDLKLLDEMKEWDVTIKDGLSDKSW